MLHRLKGRPTAYIIAAILGVAGIGGLSSAVAQQGQGQGQTTQGQGQGQQGQTTQGQGSGAGQGQGQLFPSDCSQGQGQNCADCAQGQGQGCNPDTAAQEADTSEHVVVRSEGADAVDTERVHFGG
jgi:hypothetical protein